MQCRYLARGSSQNIRDMFSCPLPKQEDQDTNHARFRNLVLYTDVDRLLSKVVCV